MKNIFIMILLALTGINAAYAESPTERSDISTLDASDRNNEENDFDEDYDYEWEDRYWDEMNVGFGGD
jgi:hypothetical protein